MSDVPVNGRWVSRQLLGLALMVMIGLIGVVFTMVQNQVARMEERAVRLETGLALASERVKTLEAYIPVTKAFLERLDHRVERVEQRRP